MDLIYGIDARRAWLDPNNKANLIGPDGPGLMQTTGYVKARGVTPRFLIVPIGQTCEATRLQINAMDPGGTATLFVWGDMAIPWVEQFSPDGHGEDTAWSSLAPWQTLYNAYPYQANGNAAKGWGPYCLSGYAPQTRAAGIVSFGNLTLTPMPLDARYADHLARLNAYLSALDYYERMGVCVNHLAYRMDLVPFGKLLQAQVDAAFGPGNWIENDNWDHDSGDFPNGVGWSPYYSELAGHRPVLYAPFSGGENGTREFYLATSQSAETAGPPALCVADFGSTLGNFGQIDGLNEAFLCFALAAFWTSYGCPDLSRWLAGTESLGEAVRKHAVSQGVSDVNLCGFPLLFVNSAAQVAAAQGAPLTSADLTTIKQMLADMATSIKADYTAAIAAAVQPLQTSAGQTNNGTPTTTVPGGTSGAPSGSTGGTTPVSPHYKINCGGSTVADWQADALFSGGVNWSSPDAIDVTGLASALPLADLQCGRLADVTNKVRSFRYALPGYAPGQSVTVRFWLVEPSFLTYRTGIGAWAFGPNGTRPTSIAINGAAVLTEADPATLAGANFKAVMVEAKAVADANGVVTISLSSLTSYPYLCAIEAF